jgi:Fe-S-cluster containining protein
MLTIKSDLSKVMKLTHPCRCPSCENSCNYGSGALSDEDLGRLAERLNTSREELKEKYLEEIERFNTKRLRPRLLREDGKAYGKCVFYEKDIGCKIHEAKPLECKIAMGCKDYGEELITWFHLNYFLNPKDAESVRQFMIYLDSGERLFPELSLTR